MSERVGVSQVALERLFPETAKRSLAMRLINESKKIVGVNAVIGVTDVGRDVVESLIFLAEGSSCVKDDTLDKWLRVYDRICRTAFQREILKQPQILTEERWSLDKTADDLVGRQLITIWERVADSVPAA